MQNKGLVKLFALLFGLVSLYQLSFTFLANKAQEEANAHAADVRQKLTEEERGLEKNTVEALSQAYLENNGSKDMMLGITYDSAIENRIVQGLDLKGGINVILQISVRDILTGLADNTRNEVFNKALDDADELQKNAQETYLESFMSAFEAASQGTASLSDPDVFATRTLAADGIVAGVDDSKVEKVLNKKINEAVDSAVKVISERIDKFGVVQPNITRLGADSGRILVELPGAKDEERIKAILETTAQLEFWEAYTPGQFTSFLDRANLKLREMMTPATDTTAADADPNALIQDETAGELNPLNDLRSTIQKRDGGAEIVTVDKANAKQFMEYLEKPEIRSLLPADIRNADFVWTKTPKDSTYTNLVALKSNRDSIPDLTGDVITAANGDFSLAGKPVVTMRMNPEGAKIWEDLTGRVHKNRTFIAVVLDDLVYSAPSVTTGPISGGSTEISGNFTIQETTDLANILQAGKLPAKPKIIQSEVVGASLGKKAVKTGTQSFIFALLFVLIWMVFYYGKAGLFADIALAFNILLIFGMLAGLKAALTLPGIAGIVLTIGMSVDANVLIFERIREELRLGKSQMDAIKDGFSNALSSILDANITTGLTGIILLVFGTGPIKGFATTLLIGIFTSLFTAIFITRLLIHWYVGNGKNTLTFSSSITKSWFTNVRVNFLKKRKLSYVISGVLIVASLASLFTNKLNYGIEFEGGTSYTVHLDKDFATEDITNNFKGVFTDASGVEVMPEIKTIGGESEKNLKVNIKSFVPQDVANIEDVDAYLKEEMFKAMTKYLPENYTLLQYNKSDTEFGITSSYKVEESISDDYKFNSLWAVVGSLFVVFLYILFRFRWWQFSLGAVVAVFHDVLIVLGIFSLTYKFMPFSMEINQAFIAAILTVIGYSLNDTVVVFDRIREYYNKNEDWGFGKTVNRALSSTLSRTLNTSFTTLIVLITIFIFGAESLKGLIFALIIGVLVGTYSSLFIATPVMFDTVGKKELKRDKIEEEESEEEIEE